MKTPQKLGSYNGQTYSRYFVRVLQEGLAQTLWRNELEIEIIASSPVEACNAVRDEFITRVEHPTSFECTGPRGGVVHRFVGWESMIGHQMFHRPDHQLELI